MQMQLISLRDVPSVGNPSIPIDGAYIAFMPGEPPFVPRVQVDVLMRFSLEERTRGSCLIRDGGVAALGLLRLPVSEPPS